MDKERDIAWLNKEKAGAKAALNGTITTEQRERLEKIVKAVPMAIKRIRVRKTEYDLTEMIDDCYRKV